MENSTLVINPLYMSGTTQLTETYFASYTPVAVEDFGAGDKRFVLKHSTGSLLTFTMSSTWTRTGNLPWIETNDPTAFNTAEADYGVDFNNDGVTGRILTALESTGTALNKDQNGNSTLVINRFTCLVRHNSPKPTSHPTHQ